MIFLTSFFGQQPSWVFCRRSGGKQHVPSDDCRDVMHETEFRQNAAAF